jgi:hypothetical protein
MKKYFTHPGGFAAFFLWRLVMKKITLERKVAMWDELSTEQKESEIEKLMGEKYGLQVFFEGAYECYDYTLQDIENETLREQPVKYKAVKFIRDKVFWQSGTQGWYYDHCGPSYFIVYKDFCKTTKHYCLELRDVDTYRPSCGGRWDYEHSFEWYLSITVGGITHEYTGEFADIQTEFKNGGWGIPTAVIRLVKKHENRYYQEFKELRRRVEDEIRYYNDYWPDEEEIGEYFRSNEAEFVITEHVVERIAL